MPTSAHNQPDTGIRAFFTGAGLPVFIIAAVVVYEAFLLAVVFAPAGSGPWAQFSEEFKLWCFRYDPRTGGMSWASVWVMLLEPVFVAGLAVTLGFRALGDLHSLRAWAGAWKPVAGGMFIALVAVSGLFLSTWLSSADADSLPPFPGERIRTQIEPPEFRLADQEGESFALEEERGRVVLMTGVYTMCATSCPEILLQVRELLDELPEEARSRLSVVALSLNPEYDTSELMLNVVEGYGFSHPEFRYLNGDPDEMHDLLTRLHFAPVRNPQTGVIDHTNLFHLVDTEGRIAYRLTLDRRHRQWLYDAVLALTSEATARQQPSAASLAAHP